MSPLRFPRSLSGRPPLAKDDLTSVRRARAAENQLLLHAITRRIDRLTDEFDRLIGTPISFACECSDTACELRILVPREDYPAADLAQFLVALDHVEPLYDRVVKLAHGAAVVAKPVPAGG